MKRNGEHFRGDGYVQYLFLKDLFIYLFLDRGERSEKERERKVNVWLSLACPHWGPGPQPRHVP